MSLRVITARLNGTPDDGPVLAGALALSQAFEGHIDAVFSRPDPREVVAALDDGVYPGFYDEMLSAMEREWTDVANKCLKHFEKWRTANGIRQAAKPDGGVGATAEFRESAGDESESIGHKGHVCDIIVAALPAKKLEKGQDPGFEVGLLDTGRPLLLVPAGTHNSLTSGKVLIAWNGSAEATRAVAAAMPILIRAAEVDIFTAPEGDGDTGAAQGLAAYLKWHGVDAKILDQASSGGEGVEERLMNAVKKSKANLLVMGAYTHSRLRELIFGGVTRHILAHAHLPVLMAH